jgi:hypothetical protein
MCSRCCAVCMTAGCCRWNHQNLEKHRTGKGVRVAGALSQQRHHTGGDLAARTNAIWWACTSKPVLPWHCIAVPIAAHLLRRIALQVIGGGCTESDGCGVTPVASMEIAIIAPHQHRPFGRDHSPKRNTQQGARLPDRHPQVSSCRTSAQARRCCCRRRDQPARHVRGKIRYTWLARSAFAITVTAQGGVLAIVG